MMEILASSAAIIVTLLLIRKFSKKRGKKLAIIEVPYKNKTDLDLNSHVLFHMNSEVVQLGGKVHL